MFLIALLTNTGLEHTAGSALLNHTITCFFGRCCFNGDDLRFVRYSKAVIPFELLDQ
ncbi:hypothetical protein PMAG_a3154 [Pseudoalteromonas mariniglutinosa NCIMB 1770]|nr:hypothetical protein [Pseudoalteromonas mariniglutinosa NCIMB 1770]